MAAYDIVRSYRATVSNTGRELESHARVIAEQTARSVQAIDVVLRHVVEQFRVGTLPALSSQDLHVYLKEQAIGLVQSEGIVIFHANGDVRASSLVPPAELLPVNVSGAPTFQAVRADRNTGLFIGNAQQSFIEPKWIVPMGRRLESASGEFGGVVGARGRIECFQQFYRDVRLGEGTSIALMRQKGTLLARHPPAESALGQHFPLFGELLASQTAGAPAPVRAVSPVDGVERFVALSKVPDFPLVVVVTRDAAVALAPWRAQAIGTAVRTLALSALAALLLVIVMRQFSRLNAARQSLEVSQRRYALAVAGSGIWDWDLATDALFLSPRAQEFMGLEPRETLQPRRNWIAGSTYHPEDVSLVRAATSAHLRGETKQFEVEYRMRHANGSWRWYRQRGMAVRDEHGRPYRMTGSLEDITTRKEAEGERDRLEGQLRQAQKLEAIGTLAGGIAHDFNNILAAILGYGEMAQKDAPEGTALRRHVDAALGAGMRAKSLVERILAFSRSGMGERVPVHVQAIVTEALDLVAASLPAGVRLERDLAAGDAAVMGDPTQVHQVVMNLCANAVQAMKASGTLTVALDHAQMSESVITTSILPSGNYLRLRVRDTGNGIAPHVLERIFDPFFTTKEVGFGTGLGLSLVHGIVTDLGGGIDVASHVGEGSTFTVYLPWLNVVAAPARVEEAVPNGAGETILLVDDEEALVRLGEEMIAELGYEPVGFTSSAAALATFRAAPERFNAVLSDEAMPEMTGSELAQEIRKLRPDIPIVLMSGFVTSALSARARDAGVSDVLAKPLVSRDIARSLASALRR